MSCGITPDFSAAHQPHSYAVAHADTGPFSLAKPAMQLHADEIEKCAETSVADDRADDARRAQYSGSHAHVWPADRASFDLKANNAAGFALQIGGFSKLSVGFKSISIQLNIPSALAIGNARIGPNACAWATLA